MYLHVYTQSFSNYTHIIITSVNIPLLCDVTPSLLGERMTEIDIPTSQRHHTFDPGNGSKYYSCID